MFTHIEALRHIQTQSGIFSTLCKPHIHSLAIFTALAYLELEGYLKQGLHTQKPGILRILEYSETFHNCNPDAYSEPCHINENL